MEQVTICINAIVRLWTIHTRLRYTNTKDTPWDTRTRSYKNKLKNMTTKSQNSNYEILYYEIRRRTPCINTKTSVLVIHSSTHVQWMTVVKMNHKGQVCLKYNRYSFEIIILWIINRTICQSAHDTNQHNDTLNDLWKNCKGIQGDHEKIINYLDMFVMPFTILHIFTSI